MGELYRELLVRLGADAFQAVFITFTFFFWGYLRQFQKALKIFLNLFSFFLLSFSIFLWGALHFRHGSKAQLRRGKLCWNVVLRLCLFEMVTQPGGRGASTDALDAGQHLGSRLLDNARLHVCAVYPIARFLGWFYLPQVNDQARR